MLPAEAAEQEARSHLQETAVIVALCLCAAGALSEEPEYRHGREDREALRVEVSQDPEAEDPAGEDSDTEEADGPFRTVITPIT